jgi:tRNA-binding protein
MNPVEAFTTLDMRVGRILRAEPNERAHKPSYKLWIDFARWGRRPRARSCVRSIGPRT